MLSAHLVTARTPKRWTSRLIVLAGCAWFASFAVAVLNAQSADPHPKLPPGEGRDVMIRVCSQCHDPEWAAEYGNDEKAWRATVEQMRKQGAQATEAEFEQVIKYLVAAFPPK